MSTTVTLSYSDVEPEEGYLYLPSEPALTPEGEDCPLCNYPVASEPNYATGARGKSAPEIGVHRGLIELPHSAMVGEWVHLRCLIDMVELGCCALTMGEVAGAYPARHLATTAA